VYVELVREFKAFQPGSILLSATQGRLLVKRGHFYEKARGGID
jgi:hypothetical protein